MSLWTQFTCSGVELWSKQGVNPRTDIGSLRQVHAWKASSSVRGSGPNFQILGLPRTCLMRPRGRRNSRRLPKACRLIATQALKGCMVRENDPAYQADDFVSFRSRLAKNELQESLGAKSPPKSSPAYLGRGSLSLSHTLLPTGTSPIQTPCPFQILPTGLMVY